MTPGRALAAVLALPIRGYRYLISPMLPVRCRFAPTCSAYAIEALAVHGPLNGLIIAIRRILRCHPWGGSGYDPVPAGTRAAEMSGRSTARAPVGDAE